MLFGSRDIKKNNDSKKFQTIRKTYQKQKINILNTKNIVIKTVSLLLFQYFIVIIKQEIY
jgi:hypothetical protein